jgi:hypothetical protein
VATWTVHSVPTLLTLLRLASNLLPKTQALRPAPAWDTGGPP